MAITSTIVTDGIAGTIVGSIYLDGITLIDQLTYTNSPGEIACIANSEVTISSTDFLSLLQFYIAFNNVIIASVFSPSQAQYIPFTQIETQQENDGVDQLIFRFKFDLADEFVIFGFVSTYPSGTTIIEKRSPDKTLSYAQWLYFMYLAANYRNVVLNAYNL